MTGMASRYVTVLDRELHYVEWGEGGRDVVIMWHGLARTCRDFDDLAGYLCDRHRVICPDTIGRGLSQWSPEPARPSSIRKPSTEPDSPPDAWKRAERPVGQAAFAPLEGG